MKDRKILEEFKFFLFYWSLEGDFLYNIRERSGSTHFDGSRKMSDEEVFEILFEKFIPTEYLWGTFSWSDSERGHDFWSMRSREWDYFLDSHEPIYIVEE